MLIGALSQYFFGFTIFVLSTFLVLLVLVQRGRGGGLTGALGGPGGQSAFGTKAGDLFTRITIGVATAWILLCATAVFMLRSRALPETGGIDRPAAKKEIGAGAGDTTAPSSENTSALPKLESPEFGLPSSGLPNSGLPALTPSGLATPGESATEPLVAAPAAPAATNSTPPDAGPAATPETTPPAPTGTDLPPAPK